MRLHPTGFPTIPLLLVALALGAFGPPALAQNLLVNGDFTLSDGQGGAAGWAPYTFPGDTGGTARQVTPGYRTHSAVLLSETHATSIFGFFAQPVDASALPGPELLFSCYYRTEGDPGAQVSLVGFPGKFLPKEWASPYMQSEALYVPPAKDWSLLTWRFRALPGVHDLVLIFRLGGQGKLALSSCALRPYPGEVSVEVPQAGVVDNPPTRRQVALSLANAADKEKSLQITLLALAAGRPPVTVTATTRVPAGQTQPLRLTYAYDYHLAHTLRVLVQDAQNGDIYEQRDVPVPGLISAYFLAPAFRNMLLSGLPTPKLIVAGAANVAPEARGQLSVSAALMDAGSKNVFSPGDAPAGQYRLELDTPALVSGEHLVRVTARLGAAEQVIDLPLHDLPAGAAQVGYDDHMRLWANGKPVLPRGLYGATSAADVQAAAAAGFNFVVAPSARASYEVQAAAAQTGLGVVVSAFSLQGDFWQRLQDKWAASPSALGWLTYARPDWRSLDPGEVTGLYDALGKFSPTLPIFETLASPSRGQYYAGGADILVAWSMPVPNSPVRALGEMVTALQQAGEGRKPVWAIIQAAGAGRYDDEHLGTGKPGRPPTAAEMNALAYLALVHGAQGLLWYSLDISGYSGAQDYRLTRDAPDLWAAMPRLNLQLKWLAPMLLDGTREALPSVGGIELARWKYAGGTYVIAVNPSERGAVMPLPAFAPGAHVQVLFEDRLLEADKDGALQDSFVPFGVHVYVVG